MDMNKHYEKILRIPNLGIDNVVIRKKTIEIHCHNTVSSQECPNCKKPSAVVNQRTERKIRHLDMAGLECWLIVSTRQFYCKDCNKHWTEKLDFADKGKSYTMAFAKWIFTLCRQQSFSEIGCLLNICHKTVENIYYRQAAKIEQEHNRYQNVSKIGIDEIAHRKGKGDFCCVIVNLDTNEQLDILPDRKKSTIVAYFKKLGKEFCENVKVLACDIWRTYIYAGRECFPNAVITLDRFHVVKALNEGIDTFRKKLRKTFESDENFKNLKYLLFKQPQNCSPEEKKTLEVAFVKSPELRCLWNLRNEFNEIYDTCITEKEMQDKLLLWATKAAKLGLGYFDEFVKTLKKWLGEIASFAKTHVTNAATEGLNNIIRYIKRVSFGLPNFEHMRIRVLMLKN